MKRLLLVFTLLLFVASCSEQVDLSPLGGDSSSGAVSFTASVVDASDSRAELISSWSGGEQVALFVGDALYCYTIAADGTMSGDEIVVNREDDTRYTAFYPYDAALSTIEEYEALCTNGCETDYLKAQITTSGSTVALQFMHQMAALSFKILFDNSIDDISVSLAMDGDFSSAESLECELTVGPDISRLATNYFVSDGTDISSAMIKVERGSSTSFVSIKREDSSTLESGKIYLLSYAIGDFPTGSGSEDDPYVVYFADEVRKVGTGTDGWNLSSHYKLAQDIDLESVEFTPIGTSEEKFTGSFDGAQYSITALQITGVEAGQGLFKYTSGATIKNLKVGGDVSNSGGETAALIIGYATNGTIITDCETLSGSTVTNTGGNNASGIAAHITGGATITNCINRATIKGQKYSAGITGYCDGTTTTFTNCTNEGDITNSASADYTAGVAARIFSSHTVTYCSNSGTISGAAYKGGIVGSNEGGTISYCTNTGKVGNSSYQTGGIVGDNSSYATVSYCTNSGEVTSSSYRTGGIAGYNWGYSKVTNCSNTAPVEGTNYYTGGIVGHNYATSTVSGCFNTGSVKSSSNSIGGVVGYNQQWSTVTNCYNRGSVTGEGGYGYYVGGVVGQFYNNTTASNSYSTGTISGGWAGGVGGNIRDDSKVSNCYFLDTAITVDNDGDDINDYVYANCASSSTVENSSSKTETEMQASAFVTLLNGDSGTAWISDTGVNDGYPILSWQTDNN